MTSASTLLGVLAIGIIVGTVFSRGMFSTAILLFIAGGLFLVAAMLSGKDEPA